MLFARLYTLIVLFAFSSASGNCTITKNEQVIMEKAHTVMVVVEAKPEKIEDLKQALLAVVAPSRAETACLEYRLHQDKNNPAQFMLYENWKSAEAHQKQFDRSYITELASKMGDLLAKPYFVVMAEELS